MSAWILIGLVILLLAGRVQEGFAFGTPKFKEVNAPTMKQCPNNTRARDGRCPEFLAP